MVITSYKLSDFGRAGRPFICECAACQHVNDTQHLEAAVYCWDPPELVPSALNYCLGREPALD